jgi:hypothetical protein
VERVLEEIFSRRRITDHLTEIAPYLLTADLEEISDQLLRHQVINAMGLRLGQVFRDHIT